MKTLLYVAYFCNADSSVNSFCAGGFKCATDKAYSVMLSVEGLLWPQDLFLTSNAPKKRFYQQW